MSRTQHSPAFLAVRDAILALERDEDRARLAALLGCITAPGKKLGELRLVLRTIGELSPEDADRLVRWFVTYVNAWGQLPRSHGLQADARPRWGA